MCTTSAACRLPPDERIILLTAIPHWPFTPSNLKAPFLSFVHLLLYYHENNPTTPDMPFNTELTRRLGIRGTSLHIPLPTTHF